MVNRFKLFFSVSKKVEKNVEIMLALTFGHVKACDGDRGCIMTFTGENDVVNSDKLASGRCVFCRTSISCGACSADMTRRRVGPFVVATLITDSRSAPNTQRQLSTRSDTHKGRHNRRKTCLAHIQTPEFSYPQRYIKKESCFQTNSAKDQPQGVARLWDSLKLH